MRRRVRAHPLVRSVKLRSVRPSPARPTGSSSASPLENCPPYFYHITSFLSHLPFPRLVATTITASSFPASTRFSAIPSPLFFFVLFSLLSLRRSPPFVHTLPSFPLPFHRHSLSSFLLRRRRSFHGAASPQRRNLAHRHFICVSFVRRSRTLLLLLLSSFPTATSLLFLLELSHLSSVAVILSPFHENYSPPSPLPAHACNTVSAIA